jgi:hypothetical protein
MRLNPHDKDVMEKALSAARRDPAGFAEVMALSSPFPAPPQGRTTPPDGAARQRMDTIREAATAFKANPKNEGITSLRAFTNQALRDAGLPVLADEEARLLVV